MSYSPRILLEQFGRKTRMILVAVVLAGAARSLFNILLSLSVGVFYSLQFGESSGKSDLLSLFGVEITNHNRFFTVFIILLAIRVLFGSIYYYGENYVGDRFIEFLRNTLYDRQLRVRLNPGEPLDISRKLLKQGSEMNSIRSFLVKGILGPISDFVLIAGSLVLLSFLSAELTTLTMTVLILAILFSIAFGFYLHKSISEKNDRRFELMKWAESGLRNLGAVKILNRERIESDYFAKKNRRFVSASLLLHRKNSMVEAWTPITFFGLLGLVMWSVSVNDRLSDSVSGGKLVTFVLLLFYIQGSLRRILKTPVIWQKGIVSFKGLSAELNTPVEIRKNEETGRNSKGLIHVREVVFGYRSDEPLFNGINLSIQGAGLTWIGGKAGSGKTTMFKLLTAIYEPLSGIITLDGRDYSILTAFGVRKKIAVISQDVPLFGKTVFEAISFSQKEGKRELAISALTEIGIIKPQEGDGFLDERLNKISSKGIRRKLELARALLTRKDIILMDEPFDGLNDAEISEMAVILNRLATHKTIVVFSEQLPASVFVHKNIRLS